MRHAAVQQLLCLEEQPSKYSSSVVQPDLSFYKPNIGSIDIFIFIRKLIRNIA